MGFGTTYGLFHWLPSHQASVSLSFPICQVKMITATSQAYQDFRVRADVYSAKHCDPSRGCYCPGKGGVLNNHRSRQCSTWGSRSFLVLRGSVRAAHFSSLHQTHTHKTSFGEFNKMTSKFLVAPTKHGLVTRQEATHWLDFQSVFVAAEESVWALRKLWPHHRQLSRRPFFSRLFREEIW